MALQGHWMAAETSSDNGKKDLLFVIQTG